MYSAPFFYGVSILHYLKIKLDFWVNTKAGVRKMTCRDADPLFKHPFEDIAVIVDVKETTIRSAYYLIGKVLRDDSIRNFCPVLLGHDL